MEYEVNTKKRKRSTSVGTAGNTSSASASASGGEYEVFLSFRGEDTRKGFTDFLYTNLVDAGISTFKDNEELRVGEEIGPELLKAIRDSKISIPIFSSNYASSKWCLLELVQMVGCRKTLGQKILPIFYDVEPSDVRHQTGSYKKAFRRHKKRFNEGTVQGWKEALREVGELKGWELKKETDGHQGEFAKMVVQKVLLELKKNCTVVTENLVGIDHHVEKMMEFLNVDSNDVRIVGIHGMGGIGKTTITKVIYNQLSECFECCCFLADVRETSQTKGLVYLQTQLISKILKGKCPNIVDVDEGINTIKKRVCRKKVLVVLDDVDEKSQFDKLAGKRDWYGSGSRIIVTTRNKEVLNRLEVDKSYETPLMKPDHSLQLFSKHAFKRDFPLEDYDTLSRKVVSTAAGLPLALEIIGSSLFLEEKEVWNDTLMKLKEIPDEKVQEKLRISYEALDYGQKQIFLDIACLFIGEDKRNPFYMWDDCKFFPTKGINVLVRRSLVKIGDYNELMMHDQLRDLGREIVRKENFQEPGERSRLWRHEEALEILKSQMGTKNVVALSLDLPWEELDHYCFTNKEFDQLPNLRFLRVDYADLAGDFENLLSNLRWLRWQGCPENCTPTNFYLKNLVILDLRWSNITEDWEGWSQIKMATKLKVLDLSYCSHLTRTPDLSTLATLERLFLSGCSSLDQIDPSIGNLINLRVLDITFAAITKFPNAIGNLEKLEEIDASDCNNLQGEIPSNIGRLSSLRILRLNFTMICSLPVEITALSRLEHLEVEQCSILKCIRGLPSSLIKLCLLNCSELMVIQGLGKLELLTSLDLSWCGKLTKLDGLPSSLFKLSLNGCKSVERLPDLSNLKNLSELMLDGCSELMEIQGLGKLESLTSLDLSWCGKLTKLDGLPSSLFKLSLRGCNSVVRLPDLSNLKNLPELLHDGCSELMEIQGLGKLEFLTSLDLSWCGKLTKLDGLPSSLFRLSLNGCKSVERLPDLSNLKNLSDLMLDGCSELMEIEGLGKLELLTSLDLSWCGKLTKLDGLPSSLFKLSLNGCKSVERLPDLSNLKNLSELMLDGCSELMEIQGLGKLELLTSLDLSWCGKLTKLDGLPSSLFKLSLKGCNSVERLSDLSKLKNLSELMLDGCSELMEIQGLGKLELLTRLDLSWCGKLTKLDGLPLSLFKLSLKGCNSVERLPDLSNLKNLTELILGGCSELMEIQGLGKLELLTSLDLSWCRKLTKLDGLPSSLFKLSLKGCNSVKILPDLSNLKNVSELMLDGCSELTEIQGLGKLELLTSLDLSWCGKLTKLDGLPLSLFKLSLNGCKSVERLPDLSNLKNLSELKLNGCSELIEIQGLGKLELLTSLDLSWCGMLVKLDGLPSSLFKLRLYDCKSVERLPDLSNLKNLSELMLDGCSELMEIQGLGKLELLTSLDLSWCGKLTKLDGLPSSLFKLCLYGCKSVERLPDLSMLKNLSELMLDGWFELMEIQGLGKLELLTRLDLSWCGKLTKLDGLPLSLFKLSLKGCNSVERLPDLSNLKNLTELILGGCSELMEIQGLGKLVLLTSLDLSWCGKLTKLDGLPSSLFKLSLKGCKSAERLPDLSNLKNLSKLMLDGCSELMEIQGLGKLELLTCLDLSWCGKLTKLDGLPSSLFKLRLYGCKSVERLPDLSKLKNLSELMLDGCSELMEIQGLGKLELLTRLDLSWCGKLTKLDGLPLSLFKLSLKGCNSVERLPDLSNLKNLTELILGGCSELMEIQGLGKFELLTSLDLSWCGKLTKLDGLPSSLFKLSLNGCKSVERLPDLSNLKNLSELMLDGCSELMEIQGLGKLELLTSLDLSWCGKLTKLDWLPSSLFKLRLYGCKSVERLPDLSNLKNLSELMLVGCSELMEIQGLGKLELLTSLDLSWRRKLTKLDGLPSSLFKLSLKGCNSVERLPDLSELKNLSELMLDGCSELMEIQGLGKLELLTRLDLSWCGKLTKLDGLPLSLFKLSLKGCNSVERLPDLSNLKNLTELILGGCSELMEIQGLGKLELLTSLDLSWCRKLTKLDGLPSSLFKLSLKGCNSVEILPDLSNLKNVSELMLDGCSELTEIQGLGKLELLTSLDLSWCGKLTKLDGLPLSLFKLSLNGCKSVERLPDLSNLKNLSELKLNGCSELIEIQGLGKLELLTSLDLSWCGKLVKLDGLPSSLFKLRLYGCKSVERLPDLSNLKNLSELML